MNVILGVGQPACCIVSFRAASPLWIGMEGYREVTSKEQSTALWGMRVFWSCVIKCVLEVICVGMFASSGYNM